MSDISLFAGGPAPQGDGTPVGAVASAVAHGLLIASLLFLVPVGRLIPPAPQPIAVELVTSEEVAALSAPPALERLPPSPGLAPPANPSEGEAAEPAVPQNETHTATKFYSADILHDPEMARIRSTLRGFAGSERVVQLCNIEGVEQIKRAEPQYDPDTIVSYAMADIVAHGLTLSATGAAFRSRRKWYGFAFDCTVAAGYEAVTAYSFTLGDPIPEDQWEAHNLNESDEDE